MSIYNAIKMDEMRLSMEWFVIQHFALMLIWYARNEAGRRPKTWEIILCERLKLEMKRSYIGSLIATAGCKADWSSAVTRAGHCL